MLYYSGEANSKCHFKGIKISNYTQRSIFTNVDKRFSCHSCIVTMNDEPRKKIKSTSLMATLLVTLLILASATMSASSYLIGSVNGQVQADTDGDGLLDTWEINGIDENNDGIIDFVLPPADPLHKNLYIEVDYMQFDRPLGGGGAFSSSIQDVRSAFSRAPVSNPDGRTGITLLPNEQTINDVRGSRLVLLEGINNAIQRLIESQPGTSIQKPTGGFDTTHIAQLLKTDQIGAAIEELTKLEPGTSIQKPTEEGFDTTHIAQLLKTEQLDAAIAKLTKLEAKVIKVFGEEAAGKEVVPQIENLIGALKSEEFSPPSSSPPSAVLLS